jgi:hypothetical protein
VDPAFAVERVLQTASAASAALSTTQDTS